MEMIKISLAACRVNAEMTQKELGDAIGVSAVTIGSWESGKTEPSVGQLRRVGEICKFPFEYIRLPNDGIKLDCI